jgi:methionyl-tRNA formyltransferase
MPTERWRVALITTVTPIADVLADALSQMGHEPVAVISARRRRRPNAERRDDFPELSDSTAPDGLDILLARGRQSMEPLLRATRPDLALCWGFTWRIPQAALDVPRLGAINCHPAMLPRHRGPIPISWAFRDGDAQYGLTWHRMDANLDTGGILAQTTVPMEDGDFDYLTIGPRLIGSALGLLPRVLERVAAGDPGDAQSDDGASWAGYFGEDYATVEWSQPARKIHDQVRAWHLTFGQSDLAGPIAELDGERVKLLRTSLTDPGNSARAVPTGDGNIWILESEPAA